METIYERLRSIAKSDPDQLALLTSDRSLTYRDMIDQVDELAQKIPFSHQKVGVILEHGIDMILVLFALLKNGNCYVPAEPSFPIERVKTMMEEANVKTIITQTKFNERFKGMDLTDLDDLKKSESDGSDPMWIKSEDPAYILYTSGSTGRSKGVCVTQKNVLHYIRAFEHEFHIGPGDRMLQYSVCSFDIFVEEVFASLLNGACLAIPNEAEKKDLSSLMDFVENNAVTIISGFPYLLEEMNHLPSIPHSLRLLISGGDVLRGSYIDHLLDQVVIYNTYGPSETTVCASYFKVNGSKVLEDGTYPIGKAVLGSHIDLWNDQDHPVKDGEVGEIIISGDGVSLGYIGNHSQENKAFEKKGGTTYYHSGDLGYKLKDGNLAFLHRKDDQVMILGKRVEVMEVEAKLNQIDTIEEAIVRVYQDEEHLSYMIAYFVPKTKCSLSKIVDQLSESLTYFMIPSYFVQMKSLPRNANGKIDDGLLPVVLKVGDLDV